MASTGGVNLTILFAALNPYPELLSLQLSDLLRFIQYASYLKDDIMQPQPPSVHIDRAPRFLPDVIADFLAASFGLSAHGVDTLWNIIRHMVWGFPTEAEEHAICNKLFQQHGNQVGLSTLNLSPLQISCVADAD